MFRILNFVFLFLISTTISSQVSDNSDFKWHNQTRQLRYHPDNGDFVITNGNKRFTRALYGTHTAFRTEAGDLPEFALYMPGMGGNIHFGIRVDNSFRWLNNMRTIVARYSPGTMFYNIKDSLLGKGEISIQLLAMNDAEGIILKVSCFNCPQNLQLTTIFGGASNKKFSRSGDIGADPESSFYFKPEDCITNKYEISKNQFKLAYGSADPSKSRYLIGTFPEQSSLTIADATSTEYVVNNNLPKDKKYPFLLSHLTIKSSVNYYFAIQNPEKRTAIEYSKLPALFENADLSRKNLAKRIQIDTPDPYINTFGGALSVAADAIWDGTSYQHGAVAWRIPLNGWRGAYVSDPLGWDDRAKSHFRVYAKAQYTEPDSGPCVPDTERNLARQQETAGISLYTNGYISRNPGEISKPHHYDMNLVFIDQLLSHILWTGDTAFLREMWPVISRHLAWEKRNFDKDGDGLYDAYCCIWASDALQYSGGGVTHSSAYNYRANKLIGQMAPLIGKNPKPYIEEANKIFKSIQKNLWLNDKGWYAEYKDLLGLKQVHPSAGLWTVYHTIDSDVPNSFETYQTLRYVDNYIPHIPIIAKGVDKGYYMLSTTNWLPYTWSINNVVIAEMYHTALAYWQGGRPDEAFRIWKSNIIESMYLGSGHGNFTQISFYDAFRGELYRDFADPIGMASRSLVEGLFGIKPNTISGEVNITPGFPEDWNYASLNIPNIQFDYKKIGDKEFYTIIPRFNRPLRLNLQAIARKDGIKSVLVNGEKILWNNVESSIGCPKIEITFNYSDTFKVEIEWNGLIPSKAEQNINIKPNDSVYIKTGYASIQEIYDPQEVLHNINNSGYVISAGHKTTPGYKTLFLKVEQNQMTWWMPIHINIIEDNTIKPIKNESAKKQSSYKTIDLDNLYNYKVTNIFKNKYLSPRPNVPTLQLPVQGIGNWCYPMVTTEIDDSGLKKSADQKGIVKLPNGIPLKIQAKEENNILFTSLWDNFKDSAIILLSGKAKHAWFLMTGTTNPMQSRFTNGIIRIDYTDGTSSELPLINPETWWPIEQDYYTDGFAFSINAPKPLRLHLKTGLITNNFSDYQTIKGFTTTAIEGGAATILDIPLNASKKLKQLVLKTTANDVIIGLMSVTLEIP
jgi:hypothetical protein